jgi:RNA polymerase sigma-70 factor (ECF subfamily)
MEATKENFPSIAHCAMHFIFHHKDWANKRIADEVSRIMGSRTGPGNISWYKGKLKKGELRMETYVSAETIETAPVVNADVEVPIPKEMVVTDEDLTNAKGLQRMALHFFVTRHEREFNKLYKRLKPGMLYHALNLVKDSDAAEDVVSQAFVKIWLKINQYNKFWNFSTWAYRIVRNEAMQHIRKAKMLVSLDVNYQGPENNGSEVSGFNDNNNIIMSRNAEDVLSVEADPDFSLDESEEFHQMVHDKVILEMQNMSKAYKDIMIDREVNELKYKQIAAKHNININSVKTRIKRARTQIIENNPEYNRLVLARNKGRKRKAKAEGESLARARERVDELDCDLMDML